MVDRLLELGYDVMGVDSKSFTDARDFFHTNRDYFDLVIHCAAVVDGREQIEKLALGHAENLEIDAALFKWSERVRPGRLVYFSSVAAYPVRLQTFLHGRRLVEGDVNWDHPRPPDELYGWSKLTGELLAIRARQARVNVTVVRPFGVYGDGQDSRTPFANFRQQVRVRRDPIKVWGLGNQIRDFIHVSDVVEAVCVLARLGINGPVNLCSGRTVRLNEAARMFADAAGYSPDIIGDESKVAGLEYRVGSPLELNKYYVPTVSLEQGIKDMLELRV